MVSRLVSPDGEVCGYKYRKGGWTPKQPPKETWWAPGSQRSLFGLHLWVNDNRPTNVDVFLTEGETDAMALDQALAGKPYVLALSGKPSAELWGEWLTLIAKITGDEGTLYTVFDADADGDAYTAHVSRHYPHKKKACVLPYGFKDIAEYLSVCEFDDLKWETLPKLPANVLSVSQVVKRTLSGGDIYHDAKSCGIPRLDYLGAEFYPGSMTVVTAGTKAGKSSLVGQMVNHYCGTLKEKALFVPLEMGVEETQQRLGANLLGVEPHTVSQRALCDAATVLDGNLLWVNHSGSVTYELLEDWYVLMDAVGISLLVIDPLQAAIAMAGDNADSATVHIDRMMYKLQELGKRYRKSLLAVSHSNDAMPDARINPSQLRGSRAIAQVATCLLGVQRLEDGLSKVYSLAPDRRFGRMGEASMLYESGQFIVNNDARAELI